MYTPFEDISKQARLWIYQANRPLSDHEVEQTQQWGEQFIEQWAAHGQDLRASITVLHHHFLVIALDEHHHAASGCSIDSSVGFIRAVEEALGENGQPISFFDRTLIAFYENDSVKMVPLAQAKSHMAEGKISPDARMFNNLISIKADVETQWLVAVKDSWLARYLPTIEA